MSTFQHSELLPEHEILQNKILAATEGVNQGSVPEEKQAEHGKELYQINDWKYCCKLLILQPARQLHKLLKFPCLTIMQHQIDLTAHVGFVHPGGQVQSHLPPSMCQASYVWVQKQLEERH
jgi:hypothetical protein